MQIRTSLTNGRTGKKEIDMEQVYDLLDSGKKVKEVAEKFGVSESTLYRKHKQYQLKAQQERKEKLEQDNVDLDAAFDMSDDSLSFL